MPGSKPSPRAGGARKEDIVRAALERYLGANPTPDSGPVPPGGSVLDLVRDLVGKHEGPGDLSYNPKYLEGFGEE